MTEKRNITKEDILLKARLLTEGARYKVKGPPLWEPGMSGVIVLDGCDVVTAAFPNSHSCLEVIADGNDVTISEMGEVLGTGTLLPRSPWRDKLMSDGAPVNSAMFWEHIVSSININRGCAAYESGKGCKFCNFGRGLSLAHSAMGIPLRPSVSEMLASAERDIEARVIAIQNGWRGLLLLAGGATPPERRGQWLTDMIEAAMTRFRESLDEDILSELQVATDVYPPDDLGELYKWKSFGINSCEFDNQIMDPAYFKAVCPGRGEQKRWFEAQEAAAEVFGRGRGSITNVVAGIEPMAGMLEGIEERMSKGVYTIPMTFGAPPDSPMEGMRTPSAEWFVEVAEKTVDIYFRYADTLDVDLTEDDRWGYTRRGQSWYTAPSDDEKTRRLQEMGKLPPGLPKQDGIESSSTDPESSAYYHREDNKTLSINSTPRRLLADERAKAVLEKHLSHMLANPQLGLVMDMTLKQVASYPQAQITDKQLKAVDDDLSKL